MLFDFRVMTLVIACLIVTPAFSTSFLDNPDVMQTFKAGKASQLPSLGPMLLVTGAVLRRVMRTPFVSA